VDPQTVTLIIAIGGGITSILSLVAGRRQRSADALANEGTAAREISEGYMNLVDRLEKRVELLEVENEKQREYIAELEEMARKLRDYVAELEEIARSVEIMKGERRNLEERMAKVEKERDVMENRVRGLVAKLDKLENGLTNGHGEG